MSYDECLLGPFRLHGVKQCIVSSFPMIFSNYKDKLRTKQSNNNCPFMSLSTSLWTIPALTRPSYPASLLSAVNSQNHSVGNALSTREMMTNPTFHLCHSEGLQKTSLPASNSVTSRMTFYKSNSSFPGCLWIKLRDVTNVNENGARDGLYGQGEMLLESEAVIRYSALFMMPCGNVGWLGITHEREARNSFIPKCWQLV